MLHGVEPQDILSFQCPVASHDWIVLPEHISAVPGAHSPPHFLVAASHTKVQGVEGLQAPIASHVWTFVVEPAVQRVAFGMQSPVHCPSPVQAPVHAVCIWFTPMLSQRNGVLFAPHVRVPGLHDPPQATALPVPVQAKGQVVVSCHRP
jgi:hypothetical protein